MKITQELYNKLLKVKSQKKGIFSFLLSQGYSYNFSVRIKNNWPNIGIIGTTKDPIPAPANLKVDLDLPTEEVALLLKESPLSQQEQEPVQQSNVTLVVSDAENLAWISALLARAIINEGGTISTESGIYTGDSSSFTATSQLLKNYNFNIQTQNTTNAISNS